MSCIMETKVLELGYHIRDGTVYEYHVKEMLAISRSIYSNTALARWRIM